MVTISEAETRLRQFREAKNLSQGDIEKRTGLLQCYISRVENGHTVPAIETVEKICRALEVPMYQLFYEGEEFPEAPISSQNGKTDWASQGSRSTSRKPALVFWGTAQSHCLSCFAADELELSSNRPPGAFLFRVPTLRQRPRIKLSKAARLLVRGNDDGLQSFR